jgi:hypothetical protein
MVDGHDILGGESYSDARYGADHLLSEEGIYLAPGQSTSIGFDQAFGNVSLDVPSHDH